MTEQLHFHFIILQRTKEIKCCTRLWSLRKNVDFGGERNNRQRSYKKSDEELQVLVHLTFLAVRVPHFSEFLVLRSKGLSGVT